MPLYVTDRFPFRNLPWKEKGGMMFLAIVPLDDPGSIVALHAVRGANLGVSDIWGAVENPSLRALFSSIISHPLEDGSLPERFDPDDFVLLGEYTGPPFPEKFPDVLPAEGWSVKWFSIILHVTPPAQT